MLANPYLYVETGQVFEHSTAMLWAEPVEDEPAEDDPVDPEQAPAAGEPEPARSASRRRRAASAQPAGGEADPI